MNFNFNRCALCSRNLDRERERAVAKFGFPRRVQFGNLNIFLSIIIPSSCSRHGIKKMHARQHIIFHHHTRGGHTRTEMKHIVNEFIKPIYPPLSPLLSHRQKYEVEFLLQQQWYDPRLRYSNRSQYEFLNAIHHYDDIWLPDTYFIMHGDFKDPLIPVHFALRIYRNGTVNYLMRYCFVYF